MFDRPSEPNKIQFHFSCQDADLAHLALAALNVYLAQRFAVHHRLALDEGPTQGDIRTFVLFVNTPRLKEILLGLRLEGVLFGPVECGDPAALKICHTLAVPGNLAAPAGPVELEGDVP